MDSYLHSSEFQRTSFEIDSNLKIECIVNYHLNDINNVEFKSSSKINLENNVFYEYDEIKATYRLHLNTNEDSSSSKTSLTTITNITSNLSEIIPQFETNKLENEILEDKSSISNNSDRFEFSNLINQEFDRQSERGISINNISFDEESKIIDNFEELDINQIGTNFPNTLKLECPVEEQISKNRKNNCNNEIFNYQKECASKQQISENKLGQSMRCSEIFRHDTEKTESTESHLDSMIYQMDLILKSLLSEENENKLDETKNEEKFKKVLDESVFLNRIYIRYEKNLEIEINRLKRKMNILERRIKNIQKSKHDLISKRKFLLDAFKFERHLILNNDDYLNFQ